MIEDFITHWKSLAPTQTRIVIMCMLAWLFFGFVSVKLLSLIDTEEIEDEEVIYNEVE
tara:strand:- start:653 stop:826 length:174 start_codon:yes stop_codon:yes gene_type:complete